MRRPCAHTATALTPPPQCRMLMMSSSRTRTVTVDEVSQACSAICKAMKAYVKARDLLLNAEQVANEAFRGDHGGDSIDAYTRLYVLIRKNLRKAIKEAIDVTDATIDKDAIDAVRDDTIVRDVRYVLLQAINEGETCLAANTVAVPGIDDADY